MFVVEMQNGNDILRKQAQNDWAIEIVLKMLEL